MSRNWLDCCQSAWMSLRMGLHPCGIWRGWLHLPSFLNKNREQGCGAKSGTHPSHPTPHSGSRSAKKPTPSLPLPKCNLATEAGPQAVVRGPFWTGQLKCNFSADSQEYLRIAPLGQVIIVLLKQVGDCFILACIYRNVSDWRKHSFLLPPMSSFFFPVLYYQLIVHLLTQVDCASPSSSSHPTKW